jgi:hypothetical protein
MTRPHLSPEERRIDRPRSDAFFTIKAALIAIQSPNMTLDEIGHAIESMEAGLRKLEQYERAVAEDLGVDIEVDEPAVEQ